MLKRRSLVGAKQKECPACKSGLVSHLSNCDPGLISTLLEVLDGLPPSSGWTLSTAQMTGPAYLLAGLQAF
jgi:hypothetical protein